MKTSFLTFCALLLLLGCSEETNIQYELAFYSDRDNTRDIFLTDINGSSITNLTNINHPKRAPYSISWSPDGKKMVYSLFDPPNSDVYELTVENGRKRRILAYRDEQNSARYSPDGKEVVFQSKHQDYYGDIYIMNLSTRQLTRLTNNLMLDSSPAFSPDGQTIIFTRREEHPDANNKAGNGELFLINRDGTNERRFTQTLAFESAASYSPDGSKIVYHSCFKGKCDIYVINADGSNGVNLTEEDGNNQYPSWSPDGQWIAYTLQKEDKDTDIWVMKPDGSDKRAILATPFREEIAVWRKK